MRTLTKPINEALMKVFVNILALMLFSTASAFAANLDVIIKELKELKELEEKSARSMEKVEGDYKLSFQVLVFAAPALIDMISKNSKHGDESEIWRKFTFPNDPEGKAKALFYYLRLKNYIVFDGPYNIKLSDAAKSEDFLAFGHDK